MGGGRWYVIASVLVGLAVGFGVGAIVFSGGSSSSTTITKGAVSTKPIKLPDKLGGLQNISAVVAAQRPNASFTRRTQANEVKVAALTAAAYSRAFGGAAAAYRRYANKGLSQQIYAIAVRAPAPGLTIGPVVDPSYLGLATPPREVKMVGSVSCEVDWEPVVAGERPQPSSEHIASCERSTSGVTAFVGGSGFSGPSGLNAMAQLADQAWSAASS